MRMHYTYVHEVSQEHFESASNDNNTVKNPEQCKERKISGFVLGALLNKRSEWPPFLRMQFKNSLRMDNYRVRKKCSTIMSVPSRSTYNHPFPPHNFQLHFNLNSKQFALVQ